jgi:hypothetical protein
LAAYGAQARAALAEAEGAVCSAIRGAGASVRAVEEQLGDHGCKMSAMLQGSTEVGAGAGQRKGPKWVQGEGWGVSLVHVTLLDDGWEGQGSGGEGRYAAWQDDCRSAQRTLRSSCASSKDRALAPNP